MFPIETFKEIQRSGDAKIVTIDGLQYTDRQIFLPPVRPSAEEIAIETLQGVVDYVNAIVDFDKSPDAAVFIIVESPTEVGVYTTLDADAHRERFLYSRHQNRYEFTYGNYYEPEVFNILLRTGFEDSPEKDNLLKFVSGLTADSSTKLSDDGVSQHTVVQKGVTGLDRALAPSKVVLTPFRIFPEIGQPSSEFILRLKRRDDNVPTVALFRADNERWRSEAITRIKDWLKDRVEVAIIA